MMTKSIPAAQVEMANKAAKLVAANKTRRDTARRIIRRDGNGEDNGDASPPRLISKAEVCDKVGKTFPTIWLWMRQGRFPRARDCGGKPAWIESEIDAWIAALPEREYKPADTVAA